jgi:hypothetical protein
VAEITEKKFIFVFFINVWGLNFFEKNRGKIRNGKRWRAPEPFLRIPESRSLIIINSFFSARAEFNTSLSRVM